MHYVEVSADARNKQRLDRFGEEQSGVDGGNERMRRRLVRLQTGSSIGEAINAFGTPQGGDATSQCFAQINFCESNSFITKYSLTNNKWADSAVSNY